MGAMLTCAARGCSIDHGQGDEDPVKMMRFYSENEFEAEGKMIAKTVDSAT